MADHGERTIGRYTLHGELAAGGMATVHYGRLQGPVGFARTVAIKRLHPAFAKDPEFVAMFLDEARLAARIQHPNVVPTIDVVARESELFLVMEYVAGETLSRLLKTLRATGNRMPPTIAASILCGALHGLHAAHEAKDERGQPLSLIHRDVSPQNIIVGVDGVARVLDFGVAKAAGRVQTTREGQLKGKVAYMPPEQLAGEPMDRRTDVYAAAVVFWEALAGKRLFDGDNETIVLARVINAEVEPPSAHAPDVPAALDEVVLRAVSRDIHQRFATARDFASAIEDALPLASARKVGEWIETVARDSLSLRARAVELIESESSSPDAIASARTWIDEEISNTGTGPVGAAKAAAVTVRPGGRESTTMSKVSTVASPVPSKPRSRAVWWLLAAALLGGGVAAAVALGGVRFGSPDGEGAAADVAARGPEPGSADSADASSRGGDADESTATGKDGAETTSADAEADVDGPVAEPGAAASAADASAKAPVTAPPPPPKVPPAAPPKTSPPPPPKASCNPPYTLDADGIRRIKPECL